MRTLVHLNMRTRVQVNIRTGERLYMFRCTDVQAYIRTE